MARVARVGEYRGTLRDLILRLKFRGQCQLDKWLGGLMADVAAGAADLREIDAVVPVPLSWRRRLGRGYNQSELLAYAMCGALRGKGFKVGVNRDLVRVRHTTAQTHLPTSKRIVNPRGAFAVRSQAGLEGRHVCLVDDVTTTGATLKAAALALRQAGAGRVSAVVLAVAGRNED